MKKKYILNFLIIGVFLIPNIIKANSFIAFSLSEAEKIIKKSGNKNNDVMKIGGITRPFALVYDKNTNDLIIVGQIVRGEHEIHLDHFVSALRAREVYKTPPLVSIDKTKETDQTRKQIIRFEGGIENTAFGKDLLDADVILKKLGLGEIDAGVWGIESYFDLFMDYWKKTGLEDNVQSRFWFKIDDQSTDLAIRDGVSVINNLMVVVMTQVMAAQGSNIRDVVGDEFSKLVTSNFFEIANYYPPIGRLHSLFRLYGLCEGLSQLETKYSIKPKLDFWLNEYELSKIQTLPEYELLKRETSLEKNGKAVTMIIDGGIEFKSLLADVKSGSPSALRDLVLKSRLDKSCLTWIVPLDDYYLPGYPEIENNIRNENSLPSTKISGCFIGRRTVDPTTGMEYSLPTYSSPSNISKFNISSRIPSNPSYSSVGGVMLQGAATITGSEDAKVNLTNGNFSFIVDGENARLDPQVFVQFITALWSVYYSDINPGISLDPIDFENVDVHLVRYIGNVINNDLGRVMREADYTMKKWAVGTDQPDIPGFHDVEEYMASSGINYFGASRRFWFLPEDMTFSRNNDILLFTGGRMTLKTEYMFQNKATRAEPADEKFAEFFTKNYNLIAEKYSIYKELFDYAKMVSLAQYLKQKGIPLFWFLMANKDEVITEDSPGTVKQLVKDSKYFEGVKIVGGVDLDYNKGQYVYDQKAINAISAAFSKLKESAITSISSKDNLIQTVAESFSFDLENKNYTLLPQHSLTSGKDRRGIKYQTDLALRKEGKPGLELVRYYNPNIKNLGEFGIGWHLLVPYKLSPADSDKVEYANVILPKRMAIENLLSGEREILEFNEKKFEIVGYLPDSLKTSNILGLFLLTDVSYRLVDKIGNEFQFDQAGYLTDMILGDNYHFHYEYAEDFIDDFEKNPFEINKTDEQTTEFAGLIIPQKLEIKNIENGNSEIMKFISKWGIGAYIPVLVENSKYKKMVLMTDGSFRLLDHNENEIAFDPAGKFRAMAPSSKHFRAVKSISQGTQMVKFKYAVNEDNFLRITQSILVNTEKETQPLYTVHYMYDAEGRLAKADRSNGELALK